MVDDLSEVNDRLTTLEVKSEERWKAHDKNAKEMREEINSSFNKIDNKFDDQSRKFGKLFDKVDELVTSINEGLNQLPCATYLEKWKAHDKQIAWIWGVFVSLVLLVLGYFLRLKGAL